MQRDGWLYQRDCISEADFSNTVFYSPGDTVTYKGWQNDTTKLTLSHCHFPQTSASVPAVNCFPACSGRDV